MSTQLLQRDTARVCVSVCGRCAKKNYFTSCRETMLSISTKVLRWCESEEECGVKTMEKIVVKVLEKVVVKVNSKV